MIKLIEFVQRWRRNADANDCIVLQREADSNYVIMSFPFHEDTPNFSLSISEVLTLRNAIDDLVAVKMLGEPEKHRSIEEFNPTHISATDKWKLVEIINNYQLYNEFDQGARQALRKVYSILNLENGRN